MLFRSAVVASISGVWTIEIPGDDGEDGCSDDVSHNFDGATVISTDTATGIPGGVEVDESHSSSPTLVVIAIEQSDGSTAVLMSGNELYPGTKVDGAWSFTWEKSNESKSTETFKDYSYSVDLSSTGTTTWSLTPTGDALSGSVDAASEGKSSYSESDTWGEDAAAQFPNGQIPSNRYLTVTRQDSEVPATNSVDKQECGGGDCSLKVTSTCEGSIDITGARTGYETSDLADKVIVSGQQGGAI